MEIVPTTFGANAASAAAKKAAKADKQAAKATADAIRKQVDGTPTLGLRPPGAETTPRAQREISNTSREKR
jgi:hypothetical protein